MDLMTASFIEARALSLRYEAIKFPATTKMALRWLERARKLATKAGRLDTSEKVLGYMWDIAFHSLHEALEADLKSPAEIRAIELPPSIEARLAC